MKDAADTMRRALLAEALGSAFLVLGVIGSGIMAERLSDDVGIQLLANAIATSGVLVMIILTFGPVSGAHFNPAVTAADCALGDRPWSDLAPYSVAQILGGAVGAVAANVIFDLPAVAWSTKDRSGVDLWLSEVIATFGLVILIFSLVRQRRDATFAPFAVAAYIGGAYWFTSSTSFANPMVSLTRTLSDSFAGIAPASAPMFIVMQAIGAALAVAAVRVLYPARS